MRNSSELRALELEDKKASPVSLLGWDEEGVLTVATARNSDYVHSLLLHPLHIPPRGLRTAVQMWHGAHLISSL